MKVAVIGAGGHGRVVIEAMRLGGLHEPVIVLDSNPSLWGTTVMGLPVAGPLEAITALQAKYGPLGAIVGIGDNAVRRSYAEQLRQMGIELVTAIHPQAIVSPSAVIGANTLIAAGAILGTRAELGENCIVNSGATVEHECVLEASVHVAPGANLAGRVTVREGAFIGLGACVIQNCEIGAWSTVGAGTVVIRSVPPATTVVGVPAKALPRVSSEDKE